MSQSQHHVCTRNGCTETFPSNPTHTYDKYCSGWCAKKARWGDEQCCACGYVGDIQSMNALEETDQWLCDQCIDEGWLEIKMKNNASNE